MGRLVATEPRGTVDAMAFLLRSRAALVVFGALVSSLLVAAGCSGDDADECLTDLPSECSPLYPPTFHDVYTRTLKPTCALSGCHAPSSAEGGLSIGTEDETYALLRDQSFVKPNDPACSKVVERIANPDASEAMPPGAPLSAAAQCSIITWIRDGAKR
jgi:hypothetical protein